MIQRIDLVQPTVAGTIIGEATPQDWLSWAGDWNDRCSYAVRWERTETNLTDLCPFLIFGRPEGKPRHGIEQIDVIVD